MSTVQVRGRFSVPESEGWLIASVPKEVEVSGREACQGIQRLRFSAVHYENTRGAFNQNNWLEGWKRRVDKHIIDLADLKGVTTVTFTGTASQRNNMVNRAPTALARSHSSIDPRAATVDFALGSQIRLIIIGGGGRGCELEQQDIASECRQMKRDIEREWRGKTIRVWNTTLDEFPLQLRGTGAHEQEGEGCCSIM